jgi:hypothetical protein
MGLVSETRNTGPDLGKRQCAWRSGVYLAAVIVAGHGAAGLGVHPPLRLPLQPYVLRHDKRLARQSVQRIVVMVQYEVIYADLARRILVGRDCVAMF